MDFASGILIAWGGQEHATTMALKALQCWLWGHKPTQPTRPLVVVRAKVVRHQPYYDGYFYNALYTFENEQGVIYQDFYREDGTPQLFFCGDVVEFKVKEGSTNIETMPKLTKLGASQ